MRTALLALAVVGGLVLGYGAGIVTTVGRSVHYVFSTSCALMDAASKDNLITAAERTRIERRLSKDGAKVCG